MHRISWAAASLLLAGCWDAPTTIEVPAAPVDAVQAPAPPAAQAEQGLLTGRVVGISDGDTLTLLQTTPAGEHVQHKIRLHGIDTPESHQDYGSRAKQALSAIAFGKEARVRVVDRDRYGRLVGEVYVDDQLVNVQMVRNGFAWHYREYSDSEELAEAQREARAAKRGLWADVNPIPPWEFRKGARRGAVAERNSRADRPATGQHDARGPPSADAAGGEYWLNTSSNVRHNRSCKHFGTTARAVLRARRGEGVRDLRGVNSMRYPTTRIGSFAG